MKNKYLKLDNPCTEKWENMEPNAEGNYCHMCSKTVIDFTKLDPYEIAVKMKEAKGSLCARVSQKQLNTPLLQLEPQRQFNIPYGNVAAGLLLVTAIASCQPDAENAEATKTEITVNEADGPLDKLKKYLSTSFDSPQKQDVTVLKGKVLAENDGSPVVNAKISFVTLSNILTAFSDTSGAFSFEIPNLLIDNDNVINVSFSDIIRDEDNYMSYLTQDFLLGKKDLDSLFTISAMEDHAAAGMLKDMVAKEEFIPPVVIINGMEMKFDAFIKERENVKGVDRFEIMNHFHFEPPFSTALYGEKAKSGLYIYVDKPLK